MDFVGIALSILLLSTVADGDCGDDYQVSDGGVDKYMMMIPLPNDDDGVNDGDDEYLNSYLLGSQT